MVRLILSVAVLLLLLQLCICENMNGAPGQYKIANGNPLSKASFSTDYQAEFFEVYSPIIRSRYSEVYWRMMDPVELPQFIQKRFANKIMAVVGYEVDQVQKTPDGPDAPVPITWAYNHHYEAYLLNSNKAELVKKPATKRHFNHGRRYQWIAMQKDTLKPTAGSDIPLATLFSEGNGGEFRMSYHGYPQGYAQLVESPDTFHLIPMQIDTWNREESSDPEFKPGPLPKSSHIPPSAGFSGLIECPCSSRVDIQWSKAYALEGEDDDCDRAIDDAVECFAGAKKAVQAPAYAERTISDPSYPPGCSVKQRVDGKIDINWNEFSSREPSTSRRLLNKEETTTNSRVAAFAQARVNVTVSLVEDLDKATITVVGPADRWFGVGFGSGSMCLHMAADECPEGGPYAIIINSDGKAGVEERKLDFHGPGRLITTSVEIESSTVKDGNITVVLARPLQGLSPEHYSFDPLATTLPIITARGCGTAFAQHCGHGPALLTFLSVDAPKGVCEAGTTGTIHREQFNNKRCAPFPTSDLEVQSNPTCKVETYQGGLLCCQDGKSLLDKDQDIPWADEYLEYYLKFRFYFEEYQYEATEMSIPSHRNLVRLYWQTEAHAFEYDIVECREGTPASQCVQVISSRWQVRDMLHDCSVHPDGSYCTGEGSTDSNQTAGVKLIYAGPHCHAPSCLSMELYNADTGELLCHVEPIFGQSSSEVHNERGFLALPPCLWGDEKEGLAPPKLLSLETNLLSLKRNNSTLGHTGEMASWQMRGIVVSNEEVAYGKHGFNAEQTDSSLPSIRRGQLRRHEGN